MKQLVMCWENDGIPGVPPKLPEGVVLKTFNDLSDPINTWADIIKYMAPGEPKELEDKEGYYSRNMASYPNYNPDKCFFLEVDGVAAATITVICNYETSHGYIHMVACKPEFRGKGLGRLMNDIVIYVLKREKMKTAHLTTDDWRIPAIKSYLRVGFKPDVDSCDDFKDRWDAVFEVINNSDKQCLK